MNGHRHRSGRLPATFARTPQRPAAQVECAKEGRLHPAVAAAVNEEVNLTVPGEVTDADIAAVRMAVCGSHQFTRYLNRGVQQGSSHFSLHVRILQL